MSEDNSEEYIKKENNKKDSEEGEIDEKFMSNSDIQLNDKSDYHV